jgi:hypothetical protein
MRPCRALPTVPIQSYLPLYVDTKVSSFPPNDPLSTTIPIILLPLRSLSDTSLTLIHLPRTSEKRDRFHGTKAKRTEDGRRQTKRIWNSFQTWCEVSDTLSPQHHLDESHKSLQQ